MDLQFALGTLGTDETNTPLNLNNSCILFMLEKALLYYSNQGSENDYRLSLTFHADGERLKINNKHTFHTLHAWLIIKHWMRLELSSKSMILKS